MDFCCHIIFGLMGRTNKTDKKSISLIVVAISVAVTA